MESVTRVNWRRDMALELLGLAQQIELATAPEGTSIDLGACRDAAKALRRLVMQVSGSDFPEEDETRPAYPSDPRILDQLLNDWLLRLRGLTRMRAGSARLVLLLSLRPGEVHTFAQLGIALGLSRQSLKVMVSCARADLSRANLMLRIENRFGQGYSMPIEDAQSLWELLAPELCSSTWQRHRAQGTAVGGQEQARGSSSKA